MAVATKPKTRVKRPSFTNVAELLELLGGVAPERVRLIPAPGTATVRDVVVLNESQDRLHELVEGTLVEKVMGFEEARLAAILMRHLDGFVNESDAGAVFPPDAMMRILPKLVRLPDVAFISWDRYPQTKAARRGAARVAPDLAVEVLSPGNTKAEMDRKLREYFAAGVRLVWYVDLDKRTIGVFRSVEQSTLLHESDDLNGGDVLPGFRVSIRRLFAEAEHPGRESLRENAANPGPIRTCDAPIRRSFGDDFLADSKKMPSPLVH